MHFLEAVTGLWPREYQAWLPALILKYSAMALDFDIQSRLTLNTDTLSSQPQLFSLVLTQNASSQVCRL